MGIIGNEDLIALGRAIVQRFDELDSGVILNLQFQLFDHRRRLEIFGPGYPVSSIVVSDTKNHW